ncbi:uncharacterized protein [Pyrus communis]|uniref:uncharacterized protein n=1 Tax=Pyrus communis TaxID=23211 RepID=UPI0035C07A3C
MDRIKLNLKWHVDSFLATVESEWNHGCTKRKAYRALDRALKIIEGKHAEQYTKLWDFSEEVKKTNLGSKVKVKLDRGKFQGIYVSLGACKEGFKSGCRPLIRLDVCHLKSVYGGQQLCAVGIDPNDETLVIAYAVVEMENKSSWIWFLELLAVDVGIVNQGGWRFISDQQNGLILTFKKVLINSHHRFCMRHLYTNFRKLFKGKTLKDALWSIARTTTIAYFKKAIEDMKKLDEKGLRLVGELPAHHWSKSHFETHPKYDMLLNNLCESFNDVLLILRQKHIVTMLLLIHTLLIMRIQMKRDIIVNKVGDLCPKIKKKLEEAKIQSGRCIAQWSGGFKFQVDAGRGEQYVVDLVEKTCSCRKYALDRNPTQPCNIGHKFQERKTGRLCRCLLFEGAALGGVFSFSNADE